MPQMYGSFPRRSVREFHHTSENRILNTEPQRLMNRTLWSGICVLLLLACDRQSGPEICQLMAVLDAAGDTVSVWQYDNEQLRRIDNRQQGSIRRFVYDGGFLVREERFVASGNLERYRSFFYRPDSLPDFIIEYGLETPGQWVPVAKETFSQYEDRNPGLMRRYIFVDNIEILSSWCEWTWEGNLLTQETRYEGDPANPGNRRIAEVTGFIHDRNVPIWPDLPAIDPWLRHRNLISVEKNLYSYLPDGRLSVSSLHQSNELVYNRDGHPTEARMTDWDGTETTETYHYACEDMFP